MESNEIEASGFVDRLRYAWRATFCIIVNRPIICYFDDGEIYARTNPYYLKAAASQINEIADAQFAEHFADRIQDFLTIGPERRN